MNKFFIMTRGRTGSTVIIDELSKVKGVRSAAHELFLKFDFVQVLEKQPNLIEQLQSMMPFELWKIRTTWRQRLRRLWLDDKGLINHYLRNEEASAFRAGKKAFGFKLLSHHFSDNPFLKDILLERGYRGIYLKRNIPRQVISGMTAKQRGIYNKKNYQDDGRYQIDIDEFQNLLRWETLAVENDLLLLRTAGFKFIEVNYEEFMANREAFFSRILGFLDVPPEVPQASSYSVMIKDLKHTVENYQQVADCAAEMGIRIE